MFHTTSLDRRPSAGLLCREEFRQVSYIEGIIPTCLLWTEDFRQIFDIEKSLDRYFIERILPTVLFREKNFEGLP